MGNKIIDFRSDTVTRPTQAMREAMQNAELGDDVFGDDPTVNQLQEKIAAMFGVQDALFFPSGTMANQVAINVQTQSGDEILCDQTAHVYRYEGGGVAANSGVSVRLLYGNRGRFTAQDVIDNINADDPHFPVSKLVSIENTVNKGGGSCWNVHELQSISVAAKSKGLLMHMDGARLWNAMVTTGSQPKDFGAIFDSISVCFSKGLGCPVGSILLGSNQFINGAKRVRKRMGGGMRQIGLLAAACSYALENNVTRLKQDHDIAKTIADDLHKLPWVEDVMPVETNIILFKVENSETANQVIFKLEKKNILCSATGGGWIRFVTHLDILENDIENAIDILKKL